METAKKKDLAKLIAFRFVMLVSMVSLFADMTYEGARSITGPFLAVLGANAATVGFVSGFGEMIGYGLRFVSGFLADRTGRYWTIAIVGYLCNLLVVPLLALANHWVVASCLIIIERMGKALRVPPRDAMLSHAGQKMGMGWVFGLHEALDKLGAMLGPLLVAGVLFFSGDYRECFAVLLIPAIIALTILFVARWLNPHPQGLEIEQPNLAASGLKTSFWLYLAGASFIAAGFADFPLMAYHFQKTGTLSPLWIPVSYSFAMGLASMAAPMLGLFYDRRGFIILIVVSLCSCFFAPLVFLGSTWMVFAGLALWSIGVGAHESLMRAIVANMVPMTKRGSAYGVFNGVYGIFWFLGSFLMGVLYDISILWLVVFSMIIQLAAIPVLWLAFRKINRTIHRSTR